MFIVIVDYVIFHLIQKGECTDAVELIIQYIILLSSSMYILVCFIKNLMELFANL